jgi:5-methylcytosine-specific restriction enzyme B
MTTANDIRRYSLEKFIKPARERGEKIIAFTSADIHNGLRLESRYPLVCSAIDADKFQEYASVILARRDGPKQSSTVRWVFDLNGPGVNK